MRHLLAAASPLVFIRFMPVKLISVPQTGSTVEIRFRLIRLPFMLRALSLAASREFIITVLHLLCFGIPADAFVPERAYIPFALFFFYNFYSPRLNL
jgi:hypothetical protein